MSATMEPGAGPRPAWVAAFAAIAAFILGIGSAGAASGPWAKGDAAEARLLTSVEAAGDRTVLRAGLHVRLKPGWKTYWRSPGDAGRPPAVDWSRSTNVASVSWQWPVPHRFALFGIETFGYQDEVVFPLDVAVAEPGRPVALRGDADLLVCSDICVPTTFALSVDLPAGPAAIDAATSNLIARFSALVPDKGPGAGIRVERVGLAADDDALVVEASSLDRFGGPDVFIEAADWSFGPPEFSFHSGRSSFLARLPIVSGPDRVKLPGTPVTITVSDHGRAAEVQLPVSATAPDIANRMGDLWPILGLALLGGLVLNLMPCVLPVLSLKLMSIVQQRDKDRRQVRLRFTATAAGVVASMLTLAGVLIAIKSAGASVGWGVQFQNPVFLVLMAIVLTGFAVNLAGGFEIRLPSAVSANIGSGSQGLFGHFSTGALATLLATPCSAPFLGTAVGFALARDHLEIAAVFAALGFGLALPYLAVAAFPAAVGVLPRPGRWMIWLRRLLTVALAATAVWLLSVLAVQSSVMAALLVGTSLVVLGAALVLGSRGRRLGRLVGVPVALLAMTAAVASPAVMDGPAGIVTPVSKKTWRIFDEVAIPGLVAQGKVVFVDVTADWCITCQVNKKFVLERDKAAEALAAPDVVAMRADWTRPNAAIAAYLDRHDRYGIPFNIVYGPGAPRGILLPEILTESAVLEAFRRAAAPMERLRGEERS